MAWLIYPLFGAIMVYGLVGIVCVAGIVATGKNLR
jgi:hypothetical protein